MEIIQARDDLTSLIKTLSEEHGINNYKITEVDTNQKGEGYLGEIFMVTVKDINSNKQLKVLIKAAFQNEKVREIVPIRMSFQNEIYFYDEVYPAYQKFEQERGVAGVQIVPKCLKVCVKEQEELLVLENLKECGFEIFEKKLILNADHIELIFKTYGRFHGYSLAVQDQNPELHTKLIKNLYNVYAEFTKNEAFTTLMVDNCKVIRNSLISGTDDKIIEKFEKYAGPNFKDIFTDLVTKDVEYSVLLHGDCWSNNMLFKYENTADGKKPIDMRLIDWQLLKVGSPVCDLSYCLYSGASKEVFDHLDDYLQMYYDSLSTFVKELGSDPEKLFPFSVLKDHWRKYSKFGMMMALSILKMKLTVQEDIIDLNDADKFDVNDMEKVSEIVAKQRFDVEAYSRRIKELLWHMHEVDAL